MYIQAYNTQHVQQCTVIFYSSIFCIHYNFFRLILQNNHEIKDF